MSIATAAFIFFVGTFVLIIIWSLWVSIYNKSRGTISVVLDKYQFSRGEKVTGKISVNLKKVIHAQKITVSVIATKEIIERKINLVNPQTQGGVNFGNQMQEKDHEDTIFKFEMPLDGEKDYLQVEYPFEIIIPQDAAGTNSSNLNPMGAMIGGMGANMQIDPKVPVTMIDSNIEWKVCAQLYIPGKLDLLGFTQINII